MIIGLIKVTNYWLDRQVKCLERDFVEEGGIRKRMTRAGLEAPAKQERKQGGAHSP